MNGSEFIITSPESPNYNCIAWAANEDIRWWWPDPFGIYFWPRSIERRVTVDCFIDAYRTLGYEPCNNEVAEKGFDKVALYVQSDGSPTHASRQLPNGMWTSKLGRWFDIKHPFVTQWERIVCMPGNLSLDLRKYGRVEAFLKRPV